MKEPNPDVDLIRQDLHIDLLPVICSMFRDWNLLSSKQNKLCLILCPTNKTSCWNKKYNLCYVPIWNERPYEPQKTWVGVGISNKLPPNHDEDEPCHDTCRWHVLLLVCIAFFHVHLLLASVWRPVWGKFGSFLNLKLPLISTPSTTRAHVLNQFMNSCIMQNQTFKSNVNDSIRKLRGSQLNSTSKWKYRMEGKFKDLKIVCLVYCWETQN